MHSYFIHNFFRTPANTGICTTIRTSDTFIDLLVHSHAIITIFLSKLAANFFIFPKVAITAVLWLVL